MSIIPWESKTINRMIFKALYLKGNFLYCTEATYCLLTSRVSFFVILQVKVSFLNPFKRDH